MTVEIIMKHLDVLIITACLYLFLKIPVQLYKCGRAVEKLMLGKRKET